MYPLREGAPEWVIWRMFRAADSSTLDAVDRAPYTPSVMSDGPARPGGNHVNRHSAR